MEFEIINCGGCRTCELACSFHLSSEFGYQNSALKVVQKDNGDGYMILIITDLSEPVHCDTCLGLDEPVCVQFCHHKDILRDQILQLRIKQEKME